MAENSKLGGRFIEGTLQNLGGSLVIAIGAAIWQKVKHGSVDWWAIGALFVLAGVVFWVLIYFFRYSAAAPQSRPTKNPDPLRVELQKLRDDLAESANRNLEYRAKLAELQDAHAEEKRKIETTHNAELWRAKEFYRQCEEERRNALKKLEEARAPRIYLELIEPGDVPGRPMSTQLILENRGETEAHNIEVKELQLRSGRVTFNDHPIGVIHPTGKKEVATRCDGFGPAFMMNILYALRKEFGTYSDQLTRETLSIPMIVTYLDFQQQKFETTCDLVFDAIRDALKPHLGNDKPSVEFKNFRFGKAAV